ncbi:hypothetical protein [Nonomuraea wenchangensis]|uniref:hypothetical protein n=1 Tax=Nonomuraea wenchangensis TaxID=568860 RepID=UPI00331A78C0
MRLPAEIVWAGALASPTIEVVYERFGDVWRASSPQVAHLVDHDVSLEALDASVRGRLSEWLRPGVQVVYRTCLE